MDLNLNFIIRLTTNKHVFTHIETFILVDLLLVHAVCYQQTLEKICLYRDLNQVPHSSEPCVLTTRLTHAAGSG